MTPLADLEDFVSEHRPHGMLVPDGGPATAHGYELAVAFPCGVIFMRWVTRAEAAVDLGVVARLN